MEKSEFNYVRAFRQRYALSERELAFLINRSHAAMCRMEYGDYGPSLESALALQVLFRQEPKELFPGLYEYVQDRLMRRAARLIKNLEDKTDQRSVAKRDFLEGLASEDNDGTL